MLPTFAQCDHVLCRIKFSFIKGVVHEEWESICNATGSASGNKKRIPDLVLLLNAGIAAYSSWVQTLAIIQDIPVVVTDYCEEAVIQAQKVCPVLSRVVSNPFRSPLRLPNSGLRIPCFSNAFMYVSVAISYDACVSMSFIMLAPYFTDV